MEYSNGSQRMWRVGEKLASRANDPWYCMAKLRASVRCCMSPNRAMNSFSKGKSVNPVLMI